MQRRDFLRFTGAALALQACGLASAMAAPTDLLPLLQPWPGPYGGVPPFDKIKVEQFAPAFAAAMAEMRREILSIAQNPQAPTFENTLAAQEGAGRTYGRVSTLFHVYASTLNSKAIQALNREWSPKFAALADEVSQNAQLFKRIEAVYQSSSTSRLSAEQQRLAWKYHKDFVRAGAKLGSADKAKLSEYNQRLASLYTRFSQNELADEENCCMVLESEADLAGLPDSDRHAAAAAAEEKGLKGKWVIRNTRSAMTPFLTDSTRRDLREKGFRLWIARGDNPGEHDNKPLVREILRLRARRARLLGYLTHAHWRIEEQMARTPENAMKLMLQVWPAAVARARQEVADMQAMADKEGAGIKIKPWDYRFYAEKVRKDRYNLDASEIKPYLQLQKLREALFWVAGELYGLQFAEIHHLPMAHPDVRVFEVKGRDGGHVGLWYWDPYARDGKESGAWMSHYRTQERFRHPVTPIVSNNCNFLKGKPGEPVLISWEEATTMFHEFGHALHGLSSNVSYPTLAGTSVARDFVEFPSQVHENWLPTPEVLGRFALHHQSGKPMPAELVAKIHHAATFNKGFTTVEFLASAIVDLKLHLAGDVDIDPAQFEKTTLAELGMPSEIVMRHRIPHFGHVFSGDGYSAGYYSYLWSAVLDRDAFQAFVEAGGPYDKQVAKRLHDCVMQIGNTVDPAQAYRNFRGRDPSIVPLLKSRGFPT